MGGTATEDAIGGWRPNGLMQRLAALHVEARPVAGVFAPGAGTRDMRRFFALGLLAGVVLGGSMLLALPRPTAKAGVVAAPTSAPVANWQRRHQLVLDVPIVRSDAPAPFPLLVTGLDGLSDAHIVLQHLPEAVWFSRGERRDEHTWDLAGADLEDLQMTLRAGSPEAFSVDIRVVGANAALLAESSAFVRVIDRPAPIDASAAALTASAPAAAGGDALRPAVTSDAAALDWSARTSTRRFVPRDALLARASPPAPAQPSPAVQEALRAPLSPPRPPGMSALGAVSREPVPEARWLWWKLPLPAWVALGNGESGRR